MTYKELFIGLSKLLVEDLNHDVAVRVENGQTYPVRSLMIEKKDCVLDAGHPVLVVTKEAKNG